MSEATPQERSEQVADAGRHTALYGLLDALDADVKRREVRVIRTGVFVHEDAVAAALSAYQQWLNTISGGTSSTKSVEKLRRRLFNTETPQLFYLLDGNRCLPGYLMPSGDEPLSRDRLRALWSEAPLLDTREYLHPRDPILERLNGVYPSAKGGEGFGVDIEIESGRIRVNEPVLRSFAKALRGSALAKEFPDAVQALRASIGPLQRALAQAKRIPPKQRLLVPQAYVKGSFVFSRFGTLVLVADATGQSLLGCYEPGSGGLRQFVDDEVEQLGKRRVEIVELTPSDRRFLGTLRLKGKQYRLHRKAFLEVVREAGRSPSLRRKLPNRYTVRDCLLELANLLKGADWVYLKDVGETTAKAGKNRKPSQKRRLQFGPWLFETGENFSIVGCRERKKSGDASKRENRRKLRG
ncbi:MAG: hypothetical protein KDD69_18370 [Bdellovibrionales bacterium]|nr:hypothetical protein [Bdellovibrionales bacterium]